MNNILNRIKEDVSIELNAYNAVCKSDESDTLRKYSGLILDVYDANCNMRKSCYSSGMLLCLLLDEILPEWKISFLIVINRYMLF